MTIEIHEPEIEALIAQHMASGLYHDDKELLLHALRSAPPKEASAEPAIKNKTCRVSNGIASTEFGFGIGKNSGLFAIDRV